MFWSGGRWYDSVNLIYVMSACKTTDAGASWTRYNFGTATGYLYALAIDPTNSNTVYAGGYENSAPAVYKTTDAGTNWNKQPGTGLAGYVYALAVDPDNPDIVFAGTSSSLYRSTDGGSTFSTTGFSGSRTQALLIDWTSYDASVIYAGTYSYGVYRSTNGGSTWEQMSDGLDVMNINCLALDPSNYLFAGTNGGSAYRWEFNVGVEEFVDEERMESRLAVSPNPAKGSAMIEYTVNTRSLLDVSVYDVQGRLITTLVAGVQEPGVHSITWDCCDVYGRRVAAGVYFCTLTDATAGDVRKLIVIR